MFSENFFKNVVSDVLKNGLNVQNTTFGEKKVQKNYNNKKKKTFTIFGAFWAPCISS